MKHGIRLLLRLIVSCSLILAPWVNVMADLSTDFMPLTCHQGAAHQHQLADKDQCKTECNHADLQTCSAASTTFLQGNEFRVLSAADHASRFSDYQAPLSEIFLNLDNPPPISSPIV